VISVGDETSAGRSCGAFDTTCVVPPLIGLDLTSDVVLDRSGPCCRLAQVMCAPDSPSISAREATSLSSAVSGSL
jgi:hypothetical protein